MIVIDASVWVSRYLAGDVNHRESVTWLEAYLSRERLVIGPAILPAEVAGAVARVSGAAGFATRAVELMLRLPSLRLVPIAGAISTDAARLAANLGLRGADATYVTVAYRLAIPLLTWDEDQRSRGSHTVTCHTPRTIAPDTL